MGTKPRTRRSQGVVKYDGRTRAARLLRDTRRNLLAHIGGTPSITQVALVERAAQLSLRLALMDGRTLADGMLTEHDDRNYLSWSNTLARTLRQLGLRSDAVASPPTLADYIARKAKP
jgi:hypothetical protein